MNEVSFNRRSGIIQINSVRVENERVNQIAIFLSFDIFNEFGCLGVGFDYVNKLNAT